MATSEPAAASGSKGYSQYQTQRTAACLSMVLLRHHGSRQQLSSSQSPPRSAWSAHSS